MRALGEGTVWCWGEEYDGILGFEDDALRQIPLEGVVDLKAAVERTVALTRDGTVHFWGATDRDKAYQQIVLPVQLPSHGITQIATSGSTTCGRTEAGGVSCWDGDLKAHDVPLVDVRQVSVSGAEACALLGTGSVSCWQARSSPKNVAEISTAVEVASGGGVHCARLADGAVRCWGDPEEARRAERALPEGALAISSGTHSICGFYRDHGPACFATLGAWIGREPVVPIQEVLAGLRDLTDVRVGPAFACAVSAGTPYCWGPFVKLPWRHSNIDQPTPPYRIDLGDLGALRRARAIALDSEHRCVITTDALLSCWGENSHGELGVGDRAPRVGPTKVNGLHEVTAVVVGPKRTCAVAGHDLYCFGRFEAATEGTEPCAPERPHDNPRHPEHPCALRPVKVASGVRAVVLGDDSSCVITTEGTVRCWGHNEWGQLGTGDTTASTVPRTVVTDHGVPLSSVVTLRAFGQHACAIDEGGHLSCWGKNLPTTQGRAYGGPFRLTVATALATADAVLDVTRSCVLLRNGELRCWGRDHGFAFPRHGVAFEPRRIGVCEAARAVSAPSCVARANGAIWCFGRNGYIDQQWQPTVHEAALGPLVDLASSSSSVCAVAASGDVFCFRPDAATTHIEVGTVRPTWHIGEGPMAGCAIDPMPDAVPPFPGVAFTSVTGHHFPSPENCDGVHLERDEPPCVKTSPHATLSPAQVKRLVTGLNRPEGYTNILLGCFDPHHELVFRDAANRAVAEVWLDDGCTQIFARPFIPVQEKNGGGTVIQDPLTRTLRRIWSELGLPDGSPPPEPKKAPSRSEAK